MDKILIVDDDPSLVSQLTKLLDQLGYESEFITRPESIFEILELEDFDLILLDIYMPTLEGITLMKQIKTHHKYCEIPVVLLTADLSSSLISNCFESGAEDFLHKPVNPLVLKARLQSVLKIKKHQNRLEETRNSLEQQVSSGCADLKESEEKWHSLVQNTPDLVIIVDREGCVLFANHAAGGLAPKEMKGKNIQTFLLPTYHQRLQYSLVKVFEFGETDRYEVQTYDPQGREFWYETRVGPIHHKEVVVSASFISSNITQQKKAEQILKDLAQKKEQLLAESHEELKLREEGSINDDLQIQDYEGRILNLENTFQSLLSQLKKDLSPTFSQFASEQEYRKKMVELMQLNIHCWKASTQKSKNDLAESSGIWKVTMEKRGVFRTRTLDRYLNTHTLPKKPVLEDILKTTRFVMKFCLELPELKKELERLCLDLTQMSRRF